MLGRTYDNQACSVARTLEVVGERWTILILRDVFLGHRRFDEIQKRNGVARNVLSARLQRLVDEGILERRRYQERPERFEYLLTAKGLDLWPVIITMMKFGDRHTVSENGPPIVLEHIGCGGEITAGLTCERCGNPMGPRDVVAMPGPGCPPEEAEFLIARAESRMRGDSSAVRAA
jgi:DNA-binding HxlR family transcriptional regulator